MKDALAADLVLTNGTIMPMDGTEAHPGAVARATGSCGSGRMTT
jgi:hypothetical protein